MYILNTLHMQTSISPNEHESSVCNTGISKCNLKVSSFSTCTPEHKREQGPSFWKCWEIHLSHTMIHTYMYVCMIHKPYMCTERVGGGRENLIMQLQKKSFYVHRFRFNSLIWIHLQSKCLWPHGNAAAMLPQTKAEMEDASQTIWQGPRRPSANRQPLQSLCGNEGRALIWLRLAVLLVYKINVSDSKVIRRDKRKANEGTVCDGPYVCSFLKS